MNMQPDELQSLEYTYNKFAGAIDAVAKNMEQAMRDCRRTCVNCIHFDEGIDFCSIARQRPPARVIAFGCSSFEEDNIPF